MAVALSSNCARRRRIGGQKTLWNFAGGTADACQAFSALNFGKNGDIYGASLLGGINNHGTVFRLTPPPAGSEQWGESVIWKFDGADGDEPVNQLTFDSAGDLYGTAQNGGASNDGTVWKLTPPAGGSGPWTRTLIWSFSGPDGATPNGGPLTFAPSGVIYGVAHQGGTFNHGVIYSLTPPASPGGPWTEATVWTFPGPPNVLGPGPVDIALTSQGELIVASSEAEGSIFKLRPPAVAGGAWTRRLLWRFHKTDGDQPALQLPILARGVVLGLAVHGGNPNGPAGDGSVWQLAW